MSDQKSTSPQPSGPKPRKRKWFRRLFALLVLIGLVMVAIPPVIGRTSLRNRILPQLSPELSGRVSLGSTSLGWLSPIEINNLKVYDNEGTVMLYSERVQSQYTLLDLILEPSDLGIWSLSQSTVQLTVESGTSNVEEFLNSLVSEESNTPYSLSIQCVDTTLTINQLGSNHPVTYDVPQLSWEHTKANQHHLTGELLAQTTPQGSISFDLHSSQQSDGFLKIQNWDCSTLEPLALRLGRGLKINGQITEAGVVVSTESDIPQFDGNLLLKDLRIEEAKRKLTDIRSLDLKTRFGWMPHALHLEELNCQTEFGTLQLDGQVRVSHTRDDQTLSSLADELLTQSFSLDGEIQLGELANRLPGLLNIREGVEIDGGQIRFLARSIPTEKILETTCAVTDLTASESGRPLHWNNPFQAVARIHKAESNWNLEDLTVIAEGINIRGQGNLAQADFQANIDLTKFQSEWSRILDTNNWIAKGTLEGTFASRQSRPNEFKFAGHAVGTDITLGTNHSIPWQFPNLKSNVSGTVLRNLEVSDLTFDLATGKEQIYAEKQTNGLWKVTGQGDLTGMTASIFSSSLDDRLSGKYNFSTQIQESPSSVQFDQLQLTIEELNWSSGAHSLDEKKLIVEGRVQYHTEAGEIEIPDLMLNSSTLAFRLSDAKYDPNGDRSRFAGQLAARGRVERVAQLLGLDAETSPSRGILNLQLKATAHTDDASEFRWKLFTEGLAWNDAGGGVPTHAVAFSPSNRVKPETSEIAWGATAIYHPSKERIDLKKSLLDVGFMKLDVSGDLTNINTSPILSMCGTCDYDWDSLKQRFPDQFTPDLKISGTHSSPVTFTLPLDSNDRQSMGGTFPIQWERASWSGISLGPGRAEAVLSSSRIDVQPFKTSMAGGTVRLSPSIMFTERGTVIEQTPETLFEQVHLSEDICQNWMKYVSPLTADASRVEGTFSLETSKLLQFPLDNLKSAKGTGVLQVHSAQMSPGPLAMQIVKLEKQIEAIRTGTPFARNPNADPRAILTIEQQAVPFEIKDGRVTHHNLKMKIKDLDVSTSGSVGFDETMDVIVEMEIPESWTSQGKRLRDIWGATIQIPIRGSLKQPLADPRIIDSLLKQLVRGSATNFLENQLNKQLNNLFKSR